eukprot:6452314-Heterocapsa_arctica.AAC.1
MSESNALDEALLHILLHYADLAPSRSGSAAVTPPASAATSGCWSQSGAVNLLKLLPPSLALHHVLPYP